MDATAATDDERAEEPAAFVLRSRLVCFLSAATQVMIVGLSAAVVANLLADASLGAEVVAPLVTLGAVACLAVLVPRSLAISLTVDEKAVTARNFFLNGSARWEDILEITAYNAHGLFGSAIGFELGYRPHRRSRSYALTVQAGARGWNGRDGAALYEILKRKAAEHAIRFTLLYDEKWGTWDRPTDVEAVPRLTREELIELKRRAGIEPRVD